jgi:hypothetical protein
LIWKAFGEKGSTPSSFEKTFPLCKRMPQPLAEQIRVSWDRVGARVKEYRDCIHHYVPLKRTWPHATMALVADKIWSAHLFIPDNPEARSHRDFVFTKGIDALTYGWEVTVEVCELAETIVKHMPSGA